MTLRGGSEPIKSYLSPEDLDDIADILWNQRAGELAEMLLSELERLKEYEWMYRDKPDRA